MRAIKFLFIYVIFFQFSVFPAMAAQSTTPKTSVTERNTLLNSVTTWQGLVAVASPVMSVNDIVFIKNRLHELSIPLNGKLSIHMKGNTLHTSALPSPVTINGNQVTYQGKTFVYNQKKSFETNYNEIVGQLTSPVSQIEQFGFISRANAGQGEKVALSIGFTVVSLLAAAAAGGAEAAPIVIGSLLGAALVFAITAIALADEGAKFKSFKCNDDGYSILLTNGTELKLTRSANDEIVITRIAKDGSSPVQASQDDLKKLKELFPISNKACQGGKATVKLVNEKMKEVFDTLLTKYEELNRPAGAAGAVN